MSAYFYTGVPILLYMCPHASLPVSSGRVHVEFVGLLARRSQVLTLLAIKLLVHAALSP